MHLDPVADQILLSCWDLAIADDISFPAVIGLFTAGPECDLLKWRFELDAAGEVIRQTEMDEGRLRSFRSSNRAQSILGTPILGGRRHAPLPKRCEAHSWKSAMCGALVTPSEITAFSVAAPANTSIATMASGPSAIGSASGPLKDA